MIGFGFAAIAVVVCVALLLRLRHDRALVRRTLLNLSGESSPARSARELQQAISGLNEFLSHATEKDAMDKSINGEIVERSGPTSPSDSQTEVAFNPPSSAQQAFRAALPRSISRADAYYIGFQRLVSTDYHKVLLAVASAVNGTDVDADESFRASWRETMRWVVLTLNDRSDPPPVFGYGGHPGYSTAVSNWRERTRPSSATAAWLEENERPPDQRKIDLDLDFWALVDSTRG
jgi:hypothetical protein